MAAIVYICCYLLRYYYLPVDKHSAQGYKEYDKQLSQFAYIVTDVHNLYYILRSSKMYGRACPHLHKTVYTSRRSVSLFMSVDKQQNVGAELASALLGKLSFSPMGLPLPC
jgi:glucose-6-phosphate 1-dehydrogenase